MLERTFSGRLLDASACPSQWDSGGSCGRRRQCPPWRLTLHEGAGNERVSGHRTGLLCVQKAEEREWTETIRHQAQWPKQGQGRAKALGPGCSRNKQAEVGGSGAEWEGEEPFGGCGGFSFSPESGELGEGVQLGTGEVASGVRGSLLTAAGAAGGGPGRRSGQGEGPDLAGRSGAGRMVKVPRPREGAERRLGLVQPLDGEAERAGSRLRGCSRGPLGHDLQRPAVDARVGGERVDGSGGAGPSAAGARGRPFPHATCGVGPTGLCPAPRSAPRANTAERRARVPPRPGSAGPSSGRAAGAGRRLSGQLRPRAGGRPAAPTGAALCHADARWRRAPAPQLTRAAGRPQTRLIVRRNRICLVLGGPGWEPGVSGPVS